MRVAGMDMLDLGRKQAAMFESNNVAYCEVLVKFSSPRHILLQIYRLLVRMGKIIPVEDLLQEQKSLAWQTAKDIAKDRLGKKDLIELVQALLTIEYFLNL